MSDTKAQIASKQLGKALDWLEQSSVVWGINMFHLHGKVNMGKGIRSFKRRQTGAYYGIKPCELNCSIYKYISSKLCPLLWKKFEGPYFQYENDLKHPETFLCTNLLTFRR